MAGRNKLCLPLGDRPLVRWPIDAALEAGLDQVAVVIGRRDAEARRALAALPVECLENPDPARGLSSSVEIALAWASGRADAALLLLGDEPEVSADAIRMVVSSREESDAPVARARYVDRPGHPVIVRLPLAPDALPGGDVGLRGLLADASEIAVPHRAPADIDTDEDYRRVLARLPH